MSFVKLDCGILESSLWEALPDRHVFITALLMARPHTLEAPAPQIAVDSLEETGWQVPPGEYGLVEAAGVGILSRAGVEVPAGMGALERLGSPDRGSKSREFDGRRLVRVDGGFIVLNFRRYRDKDHTAAERSKRYRQRHGLTRASRRDERDATRNVTEAEAEAEKNIRGKSVSEGGTGEGAVAPAAPRRFVPPTEDEALLHGEKIGLPKSEVTKFLAHYGSNGWRVGRNPMKDWLSAMTGWRTRWEEAGRPGLNSSATQGVLPAWQVRKDLEASIERLKDELRFMPAGPEREAKLRQVEELKRKLNS